MSERAESLARRFERAYQEFVSVVEPLSADQWRADCPDDQCTVAALTHHVAIALPFQVRIFTAMAAGQPTEPLTWNWLADSNAEDAATFATCDHAETIGLLNRNAIAAAAFVAAAMALGASVVRPAGKRPDISPDYFGAIIDDPDGHRIEVVVAPATMH